MGGPDKQMPHTSFVHNGFARFVTYCLGLEPQQTYRLREAYRHNRSEFAGTLVKATALPYNMTIVNMHVNDADQAFAMLSTVVATAAAPHVLVLGEGFQAPYSRTFTDWVHAAKPSIVRVQEHKVPVTELPCEEYYLGTYAVLADTELVDSETVSATLDYGVLVHMNSRRYVVLDDDSTVVLAPGEREELVRALAPSRELTAARDFATKVPPFISARPVQAARRGGALWV